jgi:hypothetical protein
MEPKISTNSKIQQILIQTVYRQAPPNMNHEL